MSEDMKVRVQMAHTPGPRPGPKPKKPLTRNSWRVRTSSALLGAVNKLTGPWSVLLYGLVATELDEDPDTMKFFDELADKQERERRELSH